MLSKEDWERAAGTPCPQCGNGTLRLLGRKRVCPICYDKLWQKYAQKEASLGPLTECRDPKLASRVQRYLRRSMPD